MTKIKLRQLTQMDPEFAKELKEFFDKYGFSEGDYLEMDFDDFLTLVTIRIGELAKVLKAALEKREYKV